jgi:hypothetical protein
MRELLNKQISVTKQTLLIYGGLALVCLVVMVSAFSYWNTQPNRKPVITEKERSKKTVDASPAILQNQLPPTNRQIEFIGDNLAQANFFLENRRPDFAFLKIQEAKNQLLQLDFDIQESQRNLILSKIDQIEYDLTHNRFNETHQRINTLINELDKDF